MDNSNNCKEQQLQELEALESMYASDLTILCGEYPQICVAIEIRPDSEEFEKLFERDTAVLHATLPADYPNVGPHLEFDVQPEQVDEEEGDENNGTDKAVECQLLRQLLMAKVRADMDKAVEEGLGMCQLFTLVNSFQESLVQACTEHTEQLAAEVSRRAEQSEKEEQARFEGTRVTVDSFKAWSRQFEAEMRQKSGNKGGKQETSSGRLTGKQLFLADKSLNISDLQFLNAKDVDGEEDQQRGPKVQIDRTLFEDDLDFDSENDSSTDDEEYKEEEEDDDEEEEEKNT